AAERANGRGDDGGRRDGTPRPHASHLVALPPRVPGPGGHARPRAAATSGPRVCGSRPAAAGRLGRQELRGLRRAVTADVLLGRLARVRRSADRRVWTGLCRAPPPAEGRGDGAGRVGHRVAAKRPALARPPPGRGARARCGGRAGNGTRELALQHALLPHALAGGAALRPRVRTGASTRDGREVVAWVPDLLAADLELWPAVRGALHHRP